MTCAHAKPWKLAITVDCITEGGRNRPGLAWYEFECGTCGEVTDRRPMVETKWTLGDAVAHAGGGPELEKWLKRMHEGGGLQMPASGKLVFGCDGTGCTCQDRKHTVEDDLT